MALLDKLFGKPIASSDQDEQRIGVLAGLPILGLDGLSSAAYGPEAALAILLPLGALGLQYIGPIILVILALLGILYFSYRQTIAAYPNGGGSYTVARENLGLPAGLLAAAALMLDYILNVAVGISAGIAALTSAFPSLQSHTLALCLGTLALITLVNLRGVRESGLAFGVPTYLFVVTLLAVLAIGVYKALVSGGHPAAVVPLAALPAATVGTAALWLLLRAFASGCTAMTGVEAVSNAVGAFAKPTVLNAQRTLTAIVAILAVLLGGIAYLSHGYQIGAMDQDLPGYQSILSQLTAAVVGRGAFYYITIGSVITVLALSANTSFADFPRLCRLLSLDGHLPRGFGNLGRRLVYTLGISILSGLSALLLIAFGGITDRLIPLFAIGAFLAFTLSQAGMVVHWRRRSEGWTDANLLINGVGATATAIALAIILVAKFAEGAWITVLLIPACLALFVGIKRHYDHVEQQVSATFPLDPETIRPPVVVVPIEKWTVLSERALRFGLRISSEVFAVHVCTGSQGGPAAPEGKPAGSQGGSQAEPDALAALQAAWTRDVAEPLRKADRAIPELVLLESPYRQVLAPFLEYVEDLKKRNPSRLIAVVIPELVERRWYEVLLHNHRATQMKAALLLYGDSQVVVINVPWYLVSEDMLQSHRDIARARAWERR